MASEGRRKTVVVPKELRRLSPRTLTNDHLAKLSDAARNANLIPSDADLSPFQVRMLSHVVDGGRLVFQAPTGIGKSAALSLVPLAIKLLLGDHGVDPSDPPLLVLYVYPLEALRKGMLGQFERLGYDSILQHPNDWGSMMRSGEHPDVVVVASSAADMPRFIKVLKLAAKDRVCAVLVDEVHLCVQWSHDFREELKQTLTHLSHTKWPIVFSSATVSTDHYKELASSFGLLEKHVVQSYRDDIRYGCLKRQVVDNFVPLLVMYAVSLAENENLFVFGRIDAIVELKLALRLFAPMIPTPTFWSQNKHEVHGETTQLFHPSGRNVIFGTAAIATGVNLPKIRHVIAIDVSDVCEFQQVAGRANRERNTTWTIDAVMCFTSHWYGKSKLRSQMNVSRDGHCRRSAVTSACIQHPSRSSSAVCGQCDICDPTFAAHLDFLLQPLSCQPKYVDFEQEQEAFFLGQGFAQSKPAMHRLSHHYEKAMDPSDNSTLCASSVGDDPTDDQDDGDDGDDWDDWGDYDVEDSDLFDGTLF
eukprot:TRINITY_DN12211_c0_g10_i3.p1 TRINITY_DN12211_c0_g10~~TRINITY_DN12211_c0_g10_i3.p1  ORF type:complete len:531 (+),score=41.11 TRINITY_DN12211_c0_g10_i3:319-1911(+)